MKNYFKMADNPKEFKKYWATPNWSKGSVGQILNPKSKFPDSKSKIHEKFGRNFLWPKKNLCQKKCWTEKNLGQKKFWVGIFWG